MQTTSIFSAFTPATARRVIRAAAAVALAGGATLGLAASAASASPVPGSSNGSLGVYTIPSTPPTTDSGEAVLPSTPGALGAEAELAAGFNGSNQQVLTIPNGAIAQGTHVNTSWLVSAPDQAWYFQLVGTVDVTTPADYLLNGVVWQDEASVYRIINYNPDGLHTCLQAADFADTPTVGSAAESSGCQAFGWNQANQLWIVGTAGSSEPVVGTGGAIGSTETYSSSLQSNYPPGAVIENVASLETNGWFTNSTPVLAAQANLVGELSPVTIQSQAWPTTVDNATWNLVDLAPPASSGSSATCAFYSCLTNNN
ncbi:MAG: hypothetical protein ACLP0J_07335 [Solirubrobacteraceae bacterium]